ncbi:MAG: BMP family ABC transporter substrate-binding protein [Desulfovibrio sp.]|jgi:basic membrane protein A|nr:BMP family ABC transporter substrate-binding protein [Desulfovibrio sp.]
MPFLTSLPCGICLFVACSLAFFPAPGHSADKNAAQPCRVALLLEHEDGDWAELLRAGLNRAEKDFPLHVTVLTVPSHEDQQAVFRQAAREQDLVLVASDGFHEILRNNAANFRQTKFGCIDAGIRAPNIMSVSFADEQAAFLAGAGAAILTVATALPGVNSKKIVGWLSGEDIPALRSQLDGFSEGARLIDPETRVVAANVGSFTDVESARVKARELLDGGADVLVLAAGRGNAAALDLVRERGVYAIAVDMNRDKSLPGRVLTTIVKRVDKAVYDIVSAAVGNFRGGEISVYDLGNAGVEITDMATFKAAAGKNIPPDLERRLAELRGEILGGGIKLKSLRARTLCDCLE